MTKLSQSVLDILHDHRESIDRLDAILVYTLSERFRHTKAIGKLKAKMTCLLRILIANPIKFQGLKTCQMKQD
jgi:chorismate mutase